MTECRVSTQHEPEKASPSGIALVSALMYVFVRRIKRKAPEKDSGEGTVHEAGVIAEKKEYKVLLTSPLEPRKGMSRPGIP